MENIVYGYLDSNNRDLDMGGNQTRGTTSGKDNIIVVKITVLQDLESVLQVSNLNGQLNIRPGFLQADQYFFHPLVGRDRQYSCFHSVFSLY